MKTFFNQPFLLNGQGLAFGQLNAELNNWDALPRERQEALSRYITENLSSHLRPNEASLFARDMRQINPGLMPWKLGQDFETPSSNTLVMSPRKVVQQFSDGSQDVSQEQPVVFAASNKNGAGRTRRTYSGWDLNRFRVIGNTDYNQGGSGSSAVRHKNVFVIEDRFGHSLTFEIEDTAQLSQTSDPIYSRNISIEKVPSGFVLISEEQRKASHYEACDLFEEPIAGQIIELKFQCKGNGYEGCVITLLLGCENMAGGHRNFIHKKTMGIIIEGVSPETGIPYESYFDRYHPIVRKQADEVFVVEQANVSAPIEWKADENGYLLAPEFNDASLPDGYHLLPDPLEREKFGNERFAIVETPLGYHVLLVNEDDDVAIEGNAIISALDPVKTSVDLGEGRQIIINNQNLFSIDVYDKGKKRKIEPGSSFLRIYAEDTVLLRPHGESAQCYVLSKLKDGRVLVIEIDPETFASYYNLKRGWDIVAEVQEPALISKPMPAPAPVPIKVLEPISKPVPQPKLDPVLSDIPGQMILLGNKLGSGYVTFQDPELEVTVTLTDVRVSEGQIDFSKVHVYVRTFEGQDVEVLPYKFDREQQVLSLAGLATYRVKNMLMVDGRYELVIEADHSGYLEESWQEKATRRTRHFTDPLVDGLPTQMWALPARDAKISKPASRMRVLADNPDLDGRVEVFPFYGPKAGTIHEGLGKKSNNRNLWSCQLALEAFDGALGLGNVEEGSNEETYVIIQHFTYCQKVYSLGRWLLQEHEWDNLRARVIDTDTNEFGWALELKLHFKGERERIVYLQPFTEKQTIEKAQEMETSAIGLVLNTGLEPVAQEAKQAFSQMMPVMGGYAKIGGPLNKARVVREERRKQSEIYKTFEPDLSKAAFPPGKSGQLDAGIAQMLPFIYLRNMDHKPFSLFIDDVEISGLVLRNVGTFLQYAPGLGVDKLTIKLPNGEEREAMVEAIDGYVGQYHIVDPISELAYPLWLTPTQVFFHTTPVPPELPLPPIFIKAWKRVMIEAWQKSMRHLSLLDKPKYHPVHLTVDPRTLIGEGHFWQDLQLYNPDGEDGGSVGFDFYRTASGKIRLARDSVGMTNIRFRLPGHSSRHLLLEMAHIKDEGQGLLRVYFPQKLTNQYCVVCVDFFVEDGMVFPLYHHDKNYRKGKNHHKNIFYARKCMTALKAGSRAVQFLREADSRNKLSPETDMSDVIGITDEELAIRSENIGELMSSAEGVGRMLDFLRMGRRK
ncbi:MAG: hypothetical protein ABII18_04055 [bacterium]|nr:hypothetical protein [bacterium]MBU1916510.1 hypothetical protein [bacterium]